MKTKSRVFKDSQAFLDDFFQEFGDETAVDPSEYFRLFEKPPNFQDLLKRCLPAASANILLLDGQSRAGKTWTAVGLVRELLNGPLVDFVWSSGEDSRFIYSGDRITVADGVRYVVDSLDTFLATERPNPGARVVVLLDDFFGSARLQPLASDDSSFQLVKECLTVDGRQNPLLKNLLTHNNIAASLLMTGRSSIFSLAEIRLDVPLGARVGRSERAIFQHVSGKLVGDRVTEWLDACLSLHNGFVRKNEEFNLPPMTAFSSHFPIDVRESPVIPDMLFGGDLRAIIDELKHDDRRTAALHGSVAPSSQTRLRRLMLVYVAPALVLPLPSIDRCLTGEEDPKRVRAVLSLQPESHGDFALRVPNQYYLRAIQQQLLETKSLELLADVLTGHSNSKGLEDSCGSHLHVLSRGLIERGLESIQEVLKHQHHDANELAKEIRAALLEKAESLPGAKKQPLLLWEAALISGSIETDEIASVLNRIPEEPGLASAIGWGLYRFSRVIPLGKTSESVALTHICRAFERRAKEVGEKVDHRVLTVAYSNFIRWAAQMDYSPEEQSPIDKLAQVAKSHAIRPEATAALKMVLEDALIWADSFQIVKDGPCLSMSGLQSAHELWKVLESESTESRGNPKPDAFSLANHLFSLEWHNEWKERDGYKRDVLWKWLENNQELALKMIRENPELLDDNLSYHWSHMITQWSVWARDWCFSLDPNAHEYKKEVIGCGEQKHNKGIRMVLRQAIDSALNYGNSRNSFRNAFFLLAIRSGGEARDDLSEIHAYISAIIQQAGAKSEDIKKQLVQAIYELIRQGYVDWTESASRLQESDDRQYLLPKDLRIQCVNFLKDYGSGEWLSYLEELGSITCLDVLPHEEADLVPYSTDVTDSRRDQ